MHQALLPLADSDCPAKWVRKNAAFALGEFAPPTTPVISTLRRLYLTDDSVHVRATAAFALGGCGRRAHRAHLPAAAANLAALETLSTMHGVMKSAGAEGSLSVLLEGLGSENEPNRVGQDVSQPEVGGPYKFQVTDESDLCEGATGSGTYRTTLHTAAAAAAAADDDDDDDDGDDGMMIVW